MKRQHRGLSLLRFDSVHLSDGVLWFIRRGDRPVLRYQKPRNAGTYQQRANNGRKTGRMLFNLKEGAQCIGTTLRSSVIGFLSAYCPALGAYRQRHYLYDRENSAAA